jgi:hypothetical protein
MANLLFNSIEEGMKQAAQMLWGILMVFLKEHWFAVMIGLLLIFIVVTFKAMLGRWGSLGSFLYNFFYFGTLFVIGLIWGPEVFVNDIFHAACAVLLYPICYFLVGMILEKTGLR